MKHFFICISVLVASLMSGETIESSYTVGDSTFLLRAKTSEVTTATGTETMINYSVFKDGKFVHSLNHGGRFFSGSKSTPRIVPINARMDQVGFMIVSQGICGNTNSERVEIVFPYTEAYGTEVYISKGFISKEIPLIHPNENGADVLYYKQIYGDGGTSSSTFMPRKLVVRTDRFREGIYKGDLLSSIDILEKDNTLSSWLKPNFIGVFVAGIEDANPDLMKYAIQNYYNPEDQGWYEVYFSDGSLSHLEELIEKVTSVRELYDEVEQSLTWDLNLSDADQPKWTPTPMPEIKVIE